MLEDQPGVKSETLSDLHPAVGFGFDGQGVRSPIRFCGVHLLRLRQYSKLPAFSRHYFPGDPTKLIDWKSFARTDQLMIREDRKTASISTVVLLDCVESMMWPDLALKKKLPENYPTKFEISCRIALNLSFLHIKAGDRVSLALFNSQKSDQPFGLVAIDSLSRILEIYEYLQEAGFKDDVLVSMSSHPSQSTRPCEFGYIIGDGLNKLSWTWVSSCCVRWSYIHIMSSLEEDLAWVENEHCYFEDYFAARKREFLGKFLKSGVFYEGQVASWKKMVKEQVTRSGGRYFLVSDRTAIAEYQRNLLWE